ncbi:MAG: DUF3096 domain-containing protein, partial [Desulfobacterales bacterium]
GRCPGLETLSNFGGKCGDLKYIALQPVLAIVAGILILIKPSLLNYIVAVFLILFGIVGLIG